MAGVYGKRVFGKRLLSSTAHVSSIVSSARTGITAKLWQMRYEMQKFKNNATELQTKTVTKAPKDSFLKVDLPVASDPQVRDNYLNFRGGIRFGKLLEDIDAFAGNMHLCAVFAATLHLCRQHCI